MDRIVIPKDRKLEASKTGDTFVFDIETMGLPAEVERWGKPYPPFVEPNMVTPKTQLKEKLFINQNIKSGRMEKQIGGKSNMIKLHSIH